MTFHAICGVVGGAIGVLRRLVGYSLLFDSFDMPFGFEMCIIDCLLRIAFLTCPLAFSTKKKFSKGRCTHMLNTRFLHLV